MPEEQQGVSENVEESTNSNDTSPVSEQENAQPEERSEQDNAIPHSRVKEMVSKAEKKAYEKAVKELAEQQTQPRQSVKEETPDEEKATVDTLRQIVRQEVSPIMVRAEVRDFLETYPDAINYLDKIKEAKKSNSNLTWEDCYKLSSYEDKVKESEKKGVEKAYKNIETKKSAQTEKQHATTVGGKETPLELLKSGKISTSEFEKRMRSGA